MHQVWTIPELLQLIFAHIGGLERNVALARLARVNRQISATAIPLLWKTLYDIAPLAGLLIGCYDEEFLRKLKEGEDSARVKYLLKASDFRRFEIYAPFIKGLTSESDWNFSILCPVLYEALFRTTIKAPANPLLPRLSYLSWNVTTIDSIRAFLCIMVPSVTELRIGLRDTELLEDLPLLMERIQTVSPSIVKFGLEVSNNVHLRDSALIATCLQDFLRSQKATLQELRVEMLVLMEAIRTSPIMFPVLQRLDCPVGFWVNDESVPESNPPFFSTELFPRLKTLNGVFERASALLCHDRFIGAVGAMLTEIRLSQGSGCVGDPSFLVDAITFTGFLAAVGRSCPNLQNFSLHDLDFDVMGLDGCNSFLRPLCSCTRLEELSLSSCDYIDISYYLTNDDIIEMTQAWKDLKSLRICSGHAKSNRAAPLPNLNLDAIEILVSQCSQLRDVKLTVNAITHQAFSDCSHPRWSHSLESINFGNSPINNSGNIAIWLNGLCPWISIHFHVRGDKDTDCIMWHEVREYVRCLQRNNELAEADMRALRSENEELRAKLNSYEGN